MKLEILPGALEKVAEALKPEQCSFSKACLFPVLRDGLCAWHLQLMEISLETVNAEERRRNRRLDRVDLARQALGLSV